jgi:hypothetical protein
MYVADSTDWISECRFVSTGSGVDQSFEPLSTQCSRSYKVRFEDIGRCLKCECFVTDVFGRSSEVVSAVTAPILPGLFFCSCPIFLKKPQYYLQVKGEED